MTYIIPKGSKPFDSYTLRKLNTFNAIWKRINLIMIGQNSNINITRSFIMMEDTNSTTPSQILATIPGQKFTTNIDSNTFTNFSWYQKAIKNNDLLVTINKQSDPFNGGLENPSGFVKGFTVENFRGVVGVMYTSQDIKELLSIFFEKGQAGNNQKIFAYISNPTKEFLIQDEFQIISLNKTIEKITGDK